MNSKDKSKPKKRKWYIFEFYSEMIKLFAGLGLYIYLRPKVHRISKNVPKRIKGGVLIAANHPSMLDPLVLFSVFWQRRLYFPATKELFRKPINRFFFENMHCIFIDKDTFNTSAIRTMCEHLKKKRAIAIFPEGSINTSEALIGFKQGTAFMALRSGCPVLPVYIGSRDRWWKPIHVCIGEPVDLSSMFGEYPRSEAVKRASEYLRDAEIELEKFYNSVLDKKANKANPNREDVYVYAARIPEDASLSEVFPHERQTEIERCSCERVKREKYFVWRLLEYALADALDIDIKNLSFSKNENGKWTADRCFFSLSHTDGAVAVAVCACDSVGVDIEAVKRRREGIENRILTEREREELKALSEDEATEYIITRWTQKESIFKASDVYVFEPMRIEASDFSVCSKRTDIGQESYVLSVCTHSPKKIVFHIGVDPILSIK